jgi:alcohol dehydrogenase
MSAGRASAAPRAGGAQGSGGRVFDQHFPQRLVFGRGALDSVGSLAAGLGRSALVVTDRGLLATGLVERVVDSLRRAGLAVHVFADVAPNPTTDQVEAGLAAGAERAIDVVVAVGGGSVHDCAKAIALVATNGGEVADYVGVDRSVHPGIPVLAVNTTAGSGADVSRYAVITDPHRRTKMIIADRHCTPAIALNDPLTTLSLPRDQTVATGLDALTHAIEAVVSTAASPLTDLLALEAISLIAEALPRVVRDGSDAEGREAMLRAATFAGLAINGALVGAVHALAHALGALTDLPHGVCNGLLLPAVVEFNLPAASAGYERVARAFGTGVTAARLAATLRAFTRGLGLPSGLGAAGVAPSLVPQLVDRALADLCLTTNPRPVSREDAAAIYERAW